MARAQNQPELWTITHQNRSQLLASAGMLAGSVIEAHKAIKIAEKCSWGEERDSYLCLTNALTVLGRTREALSVLNAAKALPTGEELAREDSPLGWPAIIEAQLASRLGQNAKATSLLEVNLLNCVASFPQTNTFIALSQLLLANELIDTGNLAGARNLRQRAEAWAISRDAKEPLCLACIVAARIARASLSQARNESERTVAMQQMENAIKAGLRLARACGFGIYHIDLMLESTRLHLSRGNAKSALEHVAIALYDGFRPVAGSGFSPLLAATDPRCSYAWGIAEGRYLRAKALLLEAAQIAGHDHSVSTESECRLGEVPSLLKSARNELEQCRELQIQTRDWKLKETLATINGLENGELAHPITQRNMRVFDWITDGLSAATAAMSTAPPDQWADGRVVGVATSTFLLGALQARRTERENASRDEVVASIRKGLGELERRVSTSEAGKVAWTAELKESLSQQITETAISVEGCQGRIADLDKSIGSILDRVALVEEFVHAHGRREAVLPRLVARSFADLRLPTQNRIHDVLDNRFTKEQLSVLAERCGVDWDNIAGETKSKKAIELIKECRNTGHLAALIGEIECQRPGALGMPQRVELLVETKPNPK